MVFRSFRNSDPANLSRFMIEAQGPLKKLNARALDLKHTILYSRQQENRYCQKKEHKSHLFLIRNLEKRFKWNLYLRDLELTVRFHNLTGEYFETKSS